MPTDCSLFARRLAGLERPAAQAALRDLRIGVEREALRVDDLGGLSAHPHPAAFGAALTHPYVTTDYSEAMLELITPPDERVRAYAFLDDLHRCVYAGLGPELLWCGSMPCVMAANPEVPLARYGRSNLGRMKTVYRRGLGHRYGRAMQVIAGLHVNCSLPPAFWRQEAGTAADDAAQVSARYFDLLRNLLRCSWLTAYLFGASPAICRSFVEHLPANLEMFAPGTYGGSEATSLRMGDIGYRNRQETELGVQADYNGLDEYIDSLARATRTPCPAYREIGLREGNRRLQLNANLLQIENEYYSTVRPKCVPRGNEKPSRGLRERGVEYVELRALDVDPWEPCGIGRMELDFLAALVLYCLLEDSPPFAPDDYPVLDRNLQQVAHHGRALDLVLQRGGGETPLQTWATELLDGVGRVCVLLDRACGGDSFRAACRAQRAKVEDVRRTPSARLTARLTAQGEGYVEWTLAQSRRHRDYFRQRRPSAALAARFARWAERSRAEQAALERGDAQSFDDYLAAYETQA